jgi:hypothetical protein
MLWLLVLNCYEIKLIGILRQGCHTKITSLVCSWDVCSLDEHGMMWFKLLHTLVHDLGKYARSLLDLDPYCFKAQGVLGIQYLPFRIM